jgi:hypothetical protein
MPKKEVNADYRTQAEAKFTETTAWPFGVQTTLFKKRILRKLQAHYISYVPPNICKDTLIYFNQ